MRSSSFRCSSSVRFDFAPTVSVPAPLLVFKFSDAKRIGIGKQYVGTSAGRICNDSPDKESAAARRTSSSESCINVFKYPITVDVTTL